MQALSAADGAPAFTHYTITDADAAGPFAPVPNDIEKMADMKTLGYATPREALAEKFHMGEALLAALNPGADFGKAGTEIVVANVGPDALPAKVGRIEVDKTAQQLRAYDGAGQLEAVYPATVGSTERPAPSGTWTVRAVAPHPTYTYDPKRLTFGKAGRKLTIAAGPNNPVGTTWISLSAPTYGIHGAPDPALVGKRASHGCVRLTNGDAAQLGKAVQRGVKVSFVGTETRISS
jgi:lipoprotein-anchoring transpeptidase ErfK/SrfK